MNATSSHQEPRSGGISLAGVPWLARMIDKARLQPTGALEILDLDYPCPMDQRLLSRLGLSGQEFQQIVLANPTDDGILAALKERNAI